jgi:hypothetical protein
VLATLEATLAINAKAHARGMNVHHDYEAWPGLLVVALRLVCALLFGAGVRQQLRLHARAPAEQDAAVEQGLSDGSPAHRQQLRGFLVRLAVTGGLYLLALPMGVAVASVCRPALRHRVISVGVAMAQSVALGYLTRLLFKRSLYFKLASVAQHSGDMDAAASSTLEAVERGASFHTQ